MFYKNSIGIDIGHDAVGIVWLQSRLRGYALMEERVHPISPHVPGQQDRDRHREIAALVNSFISENDIAFPEVYLCLPEERTIVRDIRFPLAVKENFRNTVGFELEKYVPFPRDQIYYDCQIAVEDRKNNLLSLLLVVIKKEDLDPWLEMGKLFDCGLSGVEIRPTALANGLAFQEEDHLTEKTFVLVERTGTRRVVHLLHDHKLLGSRSLPADDAPLSEETLAHEFKLCLENNLPTIGRLQVAVLGNGGVPPETAEQGRLAVSSLSLQGKLQSPRLLAAFGLAIRGLRKTPGELNLMPPALRKRPDRRVITLLVILAAINLVLLLSWFGAGMIRQQMTASAMEARISRLKEEVRDLPDIERKVEDARKRIERINNFQDRRPSAVVIVKELTSLVPRTAWLERFQLNGPTVEIEGFADSASELIPLLESSPLFENVTFLSTISKTREGKERFKIQAQVTRQ